MSGSFYHGVFYGGAFYVGGSSHGSWYNGQWYDSEWYDVAIIVIEDGHDPGIRKRKKRIEERDRLIAQIKRAMGEPEPDALVAEALAPYRAPSDGRAPFVYRIDADLLAALSARLDALAADRRARDEEDDDDFILMAIH